MHGWSLRFIAAGLLVGGAACAVAWQVSIEAAVSAPAVPACGAAQPTPGQGPIPACITPVPIQAIAVHYITNGSAAVDFRFEHPIDQTHHCAITQLPWSHAEVNGEVLEVPPGPPSYQIVYDTPAPRAGSHFPLLAFGYQQGQTAHSDPADDWIELWADGEEWVGHGSGDPNFTIDIVFAADGRSGKFAAHHLRAVRDGQFVPDKSVDVNGEWTCPLA